MPIWMVNAKWSGETHIKRCKGIHADKMVISNALTNLGHNKSGVFGLINADDREAALDDLTAYMAEHGERC